MAVPELEETAVEETKPLKGIGDPGESKDVTASNGSSNDCSNPKSGTPTMFQKLERVCKWKVLCVVVLLLLVVIILMGIFAFSECQRPAEECPSDWNRLKRHCYHLSEKMMNWTASEDFCKKHGAALVVITNHTKNDLEKLITNDDFWIGLKRNNNTWKWVDGTDYNEKVADYIDGRGLNCAYLNRMIGALDCSTSRRFICSKTVGVVTS